MYYEIASKLHNSYKNIPFLGKLIMKYSADAIDAWSLRTSTSKQIETDAVLDVDFQQKCHLSHHDQKRGQQSISKHRISGFNFEFLMAASALFSQE